MDVDLRRLGLTEYQTRLYLALVRDGELTGREASKRSGVPQGRTYEILQQLIGLQLVTQRKDGLKRFSARDPVKALPEYVALRTALQHDRCQTLVRSLAALYQEGPAPSITEQLKLLEGAHQAKMFTQELTRQAVREYRLMFTYEQAWHQDDITSLRRRKVSLKVLATKATPSALYLMQRDVRKGILVRFYPVDDARIVISDTRSQLVMVNPKKAQDRVSIAVESKTFTKMLRSYFDELYDKAFRITPATRLSDLELFEQGTLSVP